MMTSTHARSRSRSLKETCARRTPIGASLGFFEDRPDYKHRELGITVKPYFKKSSTAPEKIPTPPGFPPPSFSDDAQPPDSKAPERIPTPPKFPPPGFSEKAQPPASSADSSKKQPASSMDFTDSTEQPWPPACCRFQTGSEAQLAELGAEPSDNTHEGVVRQHPYGFLSDTDPDLGHVRINNLICCRSCGSTFLQILSHSGHTFCARCGTAILLQPYLFS